MIGSGAAAYSIVLQVTKVATSLNRKSTMEAIASCSPVRPNALLKARYSDLRQRHPCVNQEANWYAMCSAFHNEGLHWSNVKIGCRERRINAATRGRRETSLIQKLSIGHFSQSQTTRGKMNTIAYFYITLRTDFLNPHPLVV
jgi:hypothetical protein